MLQCGSKSFTSSKLKDRRLSMTGTLLLLAALVFTILLNANPAFASATEAQRKSIAAQINKIRNDPTSVGSLAPTSVLNQSLTVTTADNATAAGIETPGNIIGGNNASRNEYREYTLIIGTDGFGNLAFTCGGSLISATVVLTAAHCSTEPASTYFLIPGFYSFNDNITLADLVTLSRLRQHPNYDAAAIESDIAVMVLSQPTSQPPASVFVGDMDLAGSSGTTIGTGLTQSTPSTQSVAVLQEIDIPITSNQACNDAFDQLIGARPVTENGICAGFATNSRSACSGDSGGPLYTNIEGVRTIVGTTSFGIFPCEFNRATSVFARTSTLSEFIISESPNTVFIGGDADSQIYTGYSYVARRVGG